LSKEGGGNDEFVSNSKIRRFHISPHPALPTHSESPTTRKKV
jgi:hypothetical protein